MADDTRPRLDPIYTHKEVAEALRVSREGLERMHKRGEGPPRFKVSPRHWGYPASKFAEWQRQRLEEQAQSA